MNTVMNSFSLEGQVVAITGGAGMLGRQHAFAVIEAGGAAVLLDHDANALAEAVDTLSIKDPQKLMTLNCDITSRSDISRALDEILGQLGRLDALVNNAANNPSLGAGAQGNRLTRFEHFTLEQWQADLQVGLTGALLCCQVMGLHLAEHGGGSIVNIASDLSVIAPDQRLYRQPDLPDDQQPVKPVSYSVVKSGIVGLTRYLSTYWADAGVRVNAISPGGIYDEQDPAFVERLATRIPLGRMARRDEIKASLVYLLSDAASYVNGTNLVVDGGRSCW